MGVFDQSARAAAAMEPNFVLALLRPMLGLPLVQRRWFNARSVPLPNGPDREADLIAVADDPSKPEKAWLLIYEFQSEHDPDKPEVLQLETMISLCHARDTDRDGARFLPLPVFVYLAGRCPRSEVVVQTPTGFGFVGKPPVWEVGQDSAKETLGKIAEGECTWGGMLWVSLMTGADEADVIREWLRLRDDKVPEAHRVNVTYLALDLAELVGRRIAWTRVLQGVNMQRSTLANEMIELGEMKMARKALLDAIRGRFPEVLTIDVERAITDQPSLGLLESWHSAAVRVRTGEDLLKVLRE